MTSTAGNKKQTANYLIQDLIEDHVKRDQIKMIQRLAYRAKSKLHKEGVGALCALTGPFGSTLFEFRDEDIEKDRRKCSDAINDLFKCFKHCEKNRIIAILLLNTHPGRVDSERVTRWLSSN